MGLSEATYTSNTSSRNAKEFLKCVGEELDRATEVLNNLKTRDRRKTSNNLTASPYEFLRKVDQETLFPRRINTDRPKQQLVLKATPTWWTQSALIPLPPPTESPILLLEQSEYTESSNTLELDNSSIQESEESERLYKNGLPNECLGVRLLKCIKLRRIDPHHSCKEIGGTRLLHCPVILHQDSSKSITSILSLPAASPAAAPALPAPVLGLPPGDLAAVVNKLRQMTNSVAELQSKLGKALEAKKVQQKQHQKTKHEKSYFIKLRRF